MNVTPLRVESSRLIVTRAGRGRWEMLPKRLGGVCLFSYYWRGELLSRTSLL